MSAVAIARDSTGQWAPPEVPAEEYHDLLAQIVVAWRPRGADVYKNFLSACKADGLAHAGVVSVNRVRTMLEGLDIEHHQFSAMWSHYTGLGKPMRHLGRIEQIRGSASRNNGKWIPLRMWVG